MHSNDSEHGQRSPQIAGSHGNAFQRRCGGRWCANHNAQEEAEGSSLRLEIESEVEAEDQEEIINSSLVDELFCIYVRNHDDFEFLAEILLCFCTLLILFIPVYLIMYFDIKF